MEGLDGVRSDARHAAIWGHSGRATGKQGLPIDLAQTALLDVFTFACVCETD